MREVGASSRMFDTFLDHMRRGRAIVLYEAYAPVSLKHDGTRDCNPGAGFSIPGFGIDASGIPGSRKCQYIRQLGTLPALPTAIMHRKLGSTRCLLFNFCYRDGKSRRKFSNNFMVGGKEWKESCLFFDFVSIKIPVDVSLSRGQVLVLKMGLPLLHMPA